ncbi:MAG TPA: 4Fe-4S dicluster domain-containing protein [bacterium]|nr:4Fe-4S dicluster domain-containing protein [bacterium]HPJ72218.1 4Fe-4S dicluster domain-containing protein [bacterium]HPQ66903.1 4Fe-4S dicluster domain-containing protein [bacterium]
MPRHRIVVKFPPFKIDQPIIYRLAKDFSLIFNILQARVNPEQESILVLEITGENDQCQAGMAYLAKAGLEVQPLSSDINKNEDKCTHCGACLAVCPTGALAVDPETYKVVFDNTRCIACEACVPACPARAMEIHF